MLIALSELTGMIGRMVLVGGFFFQAEDGIRDYKVTGVQTCALPISLKAIVEYSVDKKLGARALRSILEEVLADVMFDAPEKRGEHIVIDRRYALSRLKKVDLAALRDT